MNFIGSVLDGIPVVGHVKGVVHYATGNKEAGHKSMYQASRTTTVLGAGAVGALAGPGGAVAAAVYAGLATDAVASAAMQEPQGLVKGCENIGNDIAAGRNPTASIANTGFQVVMDGVGGLGMGGVSSAASQISEKAVAKTVENVAKKTVATVGEKTIQKTMQISGEEAVKMVTKRVTEQAVKRTVQAVAVQAEVVLVSTHVAMQAKERAEEEEREQRAREEREQRAREERERRTREESERRAREESERRAREERERRAREESERRAREESERRAREEREQRFQEVRERRAREERAQRAREEREQRAREESELRAREEREQRAREESERRAREESERRAREGSERRAREETERRAREETEQRAREEKEQRDASELNSDSSEPPEEDKHNNEKSGEKIDYLSVFINLLEKHLEIIFGKKDTPAKRKIRNIFKKLKQGQTTYLATIIERIHNDDILEEVVELVIKMFKEHFPDDISFPNFLSLLEFVAVYMKNEIKDRTLLYRMSERETRRRDNSIPRMSTAELRALVMSCIMEQLDLVAKIVDVFLKLRSEIEAETEPPNTIFPDFRDLFSAVYHYFKHRYVEGYGVFSVREYFDWIRLVLDKLRAQQDYSDLLNIRISRNVNANVRFEIYFSLFGRRIRMIVKFSGRDVVLSSCFVEDDEYDGDEDGMVWLKIRRF